MFEAIIGVAVALFAILAGALGIVTKQRNHARDEAQDARLGESRERALREQETDIAESRQRAREDAANVQREANSRPSDERPTGSFRRSRVHHGRVCASDASMHGTASPCAARHRQRRLLGRGRRYRVPPRRILYQRVVGCV